MDLTNVDAKSLKSLEELQVHLGTSQISLLTLIGFQKGAIKAGIMPEDMNVRAANIIQRLEVAYKMIEEQIFENTDLLPPEFDIKEVIKKLKKQEIANAKAVLKKARVKE